MREKYGAQEAEFMVPFCLGGEKLLGKYLTIREMIAYVSEKVADSKNFFGHTALNESCYSIDDGWLTYPSDIKTEDACNNTVHCRVSASRNIKRAVIVVPHWNASEESYIYFGRALYLMNIATAVMTLPLHGRRRPAYIPKADALKSADLGATICIFRQAVMDIRRLIDWFVFTGCRKIAIQGSSLGSVLALIAFSHDARICAASCLTVIGDYAKMVWTSSNMKKVQKELCGNISLPQLMKIWSVVSPMTYVELLNKHRRPVFVVSCAKDRVFYPHLTREMLRAFSRNGIECRHRTLSGGHSSVAKFPNNIKAFFYSARFLSGVLR